MSKTCSLFRKYKISKSSFRRNSVFPCWWKDGWTEKP